MPLLEVRNISQQHGDDFLLRDISFSQEQGRKLGLAGETGSGKTTLMKIVAGLGQADSGEVRFDGEIVPGLYEKMMPGHKGIAYLSQHFDVPNKYRVSELLAYANNLTDEQSSELYRLCDVEHLLHRWSQTLSGGEKQRVALARLLTETPRLLLLDEPFSNLDLSHKLQLKKVIDNACAQLGLTCMMISHEGADLLPWADEILVMRQGRVLQQGTPQQVYRQPQSEYIAGLLGKYSLLSPALAALLQVPETSNRIVRPEQLDLNTAAGKGVPAKVKKLAYYGSHYEIEVLINDELLTLSTQAGVKEGTEVYVFLRAE